MAKLKGFIALVLTFSVLFIAGCGGGGGGGPTGAGGVPTASTNTAITGTISAPTGVKPSSLSVVSLGKSTSVSEQGSFSTEVYNDGVSVVAAMPSGKDFGLMNIVATSSSSSSTAATAKQVLSLTAVGAATSNNTTISLNSKTTAVSLVFITPYLLTNDPVKAAQIISVIETDTQVAKLATIIDNVFVNSDPLSDTGLQQALVASVQSVLNTLASQQPAAQKGLKSNSLLSSPTRILQLPKNNYSSVLAAAVTSSATPYYSYQDYITVSATKNGSVYDITEGCKNIGGVDWLAEVMKLDSSQFASSNDFQLKASASRTLYQNERANVLGRLEAPAKSYFRYFDVLELTSDGISSVLFGNPAKKAVSVSATEDGVYLIRSYSGAWGDKDLKSFVRGQVSNGSTMDTRSIINNLTTASLDSLSVFVDIKNVPLDTAIKAGLNVATDKVNAIVQADNPKMKDVVAVASDVLMAMFKETASNVAQVGLPNMFGKVGKIIAGSLIDVPGKISSGGKVVDRIGQMLTSATAMETVIVVVGEPFPLASQVQNSFAISGKVTLNGAGLSGVTVTLGGAASNSTVTDANGNYAFPNSTNGTYSISAAKTGHNFTPSSIDNLTVNGADVINQNFTATATQETYSLSGTIHSGNNTGPVLSGATVSIAGKTATTSSTGTFSITGITAGTYAFSVFKSGYDTYTNPAYYLGSNQTALNFYLTQPTTTYSISGTIHAESNSGPALPGVTVSIAGRTATTSSAGTFSITGIPAGTYAFSVSKTGYETYTNPAYYVGSNQSGKNFYLTMINSSLVCQQSSGVSHNGIQFTGTTSYQLSTTAANATETATLTWEVYYQNIFNLPTGSYSGSLRAQLWAVPYSFSGGTITNSYVLGTFTPNFTGPGAYSPNQVYVGAYNTSPVSSSVSGQNPPPGTYCIVVTLEEYNTIGGCSDPRGFCYDHWRQYAAPVTFR
ncbi:MAG: Cna B domain-containing [Geobacteraceae bacterium]|nr:MAG: Cna B domain-containing [Geobacteraceae bacterium]